MTPTITSTTRAPTATSISRDGGCSRRASGVSSTSEARIGTRPEFSSSIRTELGRPSDNGSLHTRRARNCAAAGRRNRSVSHTAHASASHKNMTAMNLGNHHAGTIQIRPNKRTRKNRDPNPKGKRPRGCAGASISNGVRAFKCLLGDFNGRHDLLDHLIRRETFEVGLGLKQDPVPQNRERRALDVIRQHVVAAVHTSGRARDEQ